MTRRRTAASFAPPTDGACFPLPCLFVRLPGAYPASLVACEPG